MTKNSYIRCAVVVATVFLWLGFVGAISFMEAWIKFQAPNITLSLGLGIGRLVFAALNRMEIVCALTMFICIIPFWKDWHRANLAFSVALMILILQTFWLLPVLDARAIAHMHRLSVPPSGVHLSYVIMEGVKAILLLVVGVNVLSKIYKYKLKKP